MDLSVKKSQTLKNHFLFQNNNRLLFCSTKNPQENTDTVQENSTRHVRPTNDAFVLLTKPAPTYWTIYLKSLVVTIFLRLANMFYERVVTNK